MKNIFPLLLSSLFFLTPLRLVAMETSDESEQGSGQRSFSSQYQEKKTEDNSQGAAIAASRRSSLGQSNVPQYGSISDSATTSSEPAKPTLEAFRDFGYNNYREEAGCVYRNGFLYQEQSSNYENDQKERSQMWEFFLDALKEEYGEASQVFQQASQEILNYSTDTTFCYFPPLTPQRIRRYLEMAGQSVHSPSYTSYQRSESTTLEDHLLRADKLDSIGWWDRSWTIKYHEEHGQSFYVGIPTRRNPGFFSAVGAFLCRNKSEREANRHTLQQIAKELESRSAAGGSSTTSRRQEAVSHILGEISTQSMQSESDSSVGSFTTTSSEREASRPTPSRHISFQNRFNLRFTLGQPLTVDAYREWEKSSSDYSFPFSGAAADIYRGLAKIRRCFSSSRDNDTRDLTLSFAVNPCSTHTYYSMGSPSPEHQRDWLTENTSSGSGLFYDQSHHQDTSNTYSLVHQPSSNATGDQTASQYSLHSLYGQPRYNNQDWDSSSGTR